MSELFDSETLKQFNCYTCVQRGCNVKYRYLSRYVIQTIDIFFHKASEAWPKLWEGDPRVSREVWNCSIAPQQSGVSTGNSLVFVPS